MHNHALSPSEIAGLGPAGQCERAMSNAPPSPARLDTIRHEHARYAETRSMLAAAHIIDAVPELLAEVERLQRSAVDNRKFADAQWQEIHSQRAHLKELEDADYELRSRLNEATEPLEGAVRDKQHWMACYESEAAAVKRLLDERDTLRAALYVACDGWEHAREPGANPCVEIERLRKIADGDR